MIDKLRKRFIMLAMISLTILLALIVSGMNIINYNTVMREADETLEMISSNRGQLPAFFDEEEKRGGGDIPFKRGFAPKGMSRDEAEENRFFSALVNSEGASVMADTRHIYAVDEDQAKEYAEEAAASGKSKGFADEYRYMVTTEGDLSRVTFLDCGRVLESFRRFLFASLAMSAAGLIAVFIIMCYFAGRIVRPVAESYEKQKRFITDAGHEIKTPLAIIKANIDVMRMDLDDLAETSRGSDGTDTADAAAAVDGAAAIAGSLNDELDEIDGQVDRLTSLTNDLVYLSRMEEAGGTMTMSDVPVSDVVEDTAGSFRALADERNRELVIDVEPMLTVRGSTGELEKLVSILVENALKYSVDEDRIGVSLRREGKNVVLEVKNKAAVPLSDEELAHVFDRFYRTDKSRNSATGGHGIGLSMASAITAAHGGRIAARSGDGTQFIVTAALPAR